MVHVAGGSGGIGKPEKTLTVVDGEDFFLLSFPFYV